MPFTPYHFGPSGFIGLLFRRWIDPVIFVAANIIVDIEVLFATDRFAHRIWHVHTFLVASIVGAVFGAIVYGIVPLRRLIAWFMDKIRISYKPSLWKMVLSGALGACFHVLIDAFYHWDVQPFYPKKGNVFWHWLNPNFSTDAATKQDIRIFCLLSLVPVIILVVLAVRNYNKKKDAKE